MTFIIGLFLLLGLGLFIVALLNDGKEADLYALLGFFAIAFSLFIKVESLLL